MSLIFYLKERYFLINVQVKDVYSYLRTGLRKGNSSSLKCLGRTLWGIDTFVYTLHKNMKVKFLVHVLHINQAINFM